MTLHNSPAVVGCTAKTSELQIYVKFLQKPVSITDRNG